MEIKYICAHCNTEFVTELDDQDGSFDIIVECKCGGCEVEPMVDFDDLNEILKELETSL